MIFSSQANFWRHFSPLSEGSGLRDQTVAFLQNTSCSLLDLSFFLPSLIKNNYLCELIPLFSSCFISLLQSSFGPLDEV